MFLVWAVARFGHSLFAGAAIRWAAALAFGTTVVLLWGRFAAPKSRNRLCGKYLLAFKGFLFGLGGIAISCVYGLPFGAAYTALAVLHLMASVVTGTL